MKAALALVLLMAVAACGYHLAGNGPAIPADAHTISIHLFRNHTRERGLQVALRLAIEEEFRRQGTLRIVPDGEGDLELTGDIRRLASVPVAFSATDEAVQYQSTITIGMHLVERATGRIIQETPTLQESQDFGAESGVIISSSPHFQRGTMNARDLPDLSNVQLGETRRRAALRDLLDVLARDVYQHAMEGF